MLGGGLGWAVRAALCPQLGPVACPLELAGGQWARAGLRVAGVLSAAFCGRGWSRRVGKEMASIGVAASGFGCMWAQTAELPPVKCQVQGGSQNLKEKREIINRNFTKHQKRREKRRIKRVESLSM